jgi:hypothetical protein
MKRDYAAIAASTIAALLLAVNPAAAGDAGKKARGDVSTDTSTSATTDTKTDGSASGVSTDGSVSTDTSASGTTGGTLSTDSPSASPKMEDDKDKLDADKKTGLDRADQAAGEHGQQGRDNAREHQEQTDSSSASPRMDDQNKESSTTEEKK